jgi:hypothetical protein
MARFLCGGASKAAFLQADTGQATPLCTRHGLPQDL